MRPNFEPETEIATLLRLTIGPEVWRYQNWSPELYIHDLEPYEYLGFNNPDIRAALEYGADYTNITLENADAKVDALLAIREKFRAADGFRSCPIEFIQVFPTRPDGEPRSYYFQVNKSAIAGAGIELTLQSAPDAVNCLVPSVYAIRKYVPELPFSARRAGY